MSHVPRKKTHADLAGVTRREFLHRSSVVLAIIACGVAERPALAAGTRAVARNRPSSVSPPYPPSDVIGQIRWAPPRDDHPQGPRQRQLAHHLGG